MKHTLEDFSNILLDKTEEVLDMVSSYIAENLGLSIKSFTALLRHQQGLSKEQQEQVLPFARVTIEVLKNIGGEYVNFVQEVTDDILPVEAIMNTYKFDVFLAHNSQDKLLVKKIAQKLRLRNLNPWLDEEQIPPGQRSIDVIQQAIPRVKSAAIFLGSNGLGRWQDMELLTIIDLSRENKIPVIPLLLPGVSSLPKDLPFLKQFRWVKFAQGIDDEHALDLLQWGISGQKPAQLSNSIEKPGVVPDDLLSVRGIDYTRLRDLLDAKRWEEADHETYRVIIEVVGHSQNGFIRSEQLLNFPSTDLHTIDSLWVKFSKGQYGFSVQQKIWRAVGRDLCSFSDRVGWDWSTPASVLKPIARSTGMVCHVVPSSITYDGNAPEGHLPFLIHSKNTDRWFPGVYGALWGVGGDAFDGFSLLSRPDL